MGKPQPPLPIPGNHSGRAGAVVILVFASGPVLLMILMAVLSKGTQRQDHVMAAVVLSLSWLSLGLLLFARQILDGWRTWRMHAAGRRLGLRPVSRPSADELEEYRGFPLFRYSSKATRAAVWATEGALLGMRLRLVEYAFEGVVANSLGFRHKFRDVQTVAVLPDAGPRIRFHLGPALTEMMKREPGWPIAQGLLNVAEFPGRETPTPTVVHARDHETLEAIFTPQRLEALAAFEGFVIECCQGTLIVYRHDWTVQPPQLAAFLDTVVRIAEVMRDTKGWTPSDAASPGDDLPAPHHHGFRRDHP